MLIKEIPKKRKGDSILFSYPVNHKKTIFHLKRNSSVAQVFEQIVEQEEYQVFLNIFLEKHIVPNSMVDARANIGLTCLFFKAYFPKLNIIALEPSEETFKRLSININNNNNSSSITLLNKGLWSVKTRLKADLSFRDGLDWSFRLIEENENEVALFETISMNDIFIEYKIDYIDFLKIDIEGGEVEVFKDFKDLGWLSKVKIIALEIHDEFICREFIESNLSKMFELRHSGELTIGINKSI
jgi:FkbM family methyltransferase